MLPDLRFAIGAVLAGAVLIVTAFGLAATVRIAHHKSAAPLEGSRPMSYAEPADTPLDRPVIAIELVAPAEGARAVTVDTPVRANIVAPPLAPAAEAALEATPIEAGAHEPEHTATLPPAVEEKVTPAVEPPPTATPPAPAKIPAAKAKKARKAFAKKRKRLRIVVEQPAAGYPALNHPAIERLFLRNERAVIVD